jgi:hypothetical protein
VNQDYELKISSRVQTATARACQFASIQSEQERSARDILQKLVVV